MPAEDGFWYGPGHSVAEEGRLQARMDVDLSDVITIGIETTLNLNWPKPNSAVLPVALAVTVVRFSGTLALSFIPSSSPPSTSTPSPTTSTAPPNRADSDPPRPTSSSGLPPHRPTTLAFTFLDDYRLDLSVRSLVGSRSRLQDVPKIAQLIESRVHAWFDERAVEPRFQQIVLPSLWPRKHNTRGGATEDAAAAENEDELENENEDDENDIAVPSATNTLKDDPFMDQHTQSHAEPSVSQTLEQRIAAEGAKMREAEIKAGERKAPRPGSLQRNGSSRDEGMRWRGEQGSSRIGNHGHAQQRGPATVSASSRTRPAGSRLNSGEGWSGQKGMPGALGPSAIQ